MRVPQKAGLVWVRVVDEGLERLAVFQWFTQAVFAVGCLARRIVLGDFGGKGRG